MKFSAANLAQDYLCHLINSPFVRQQSKDNTQGIGNQNLVLRLINSFALPIPPLAEQHRIVAKVDELMALCDRLEASLASGDDTRRHLLDALLDEALSSGEEEIGQHISTIAQELPDKPPGSPEALTEPTSAEASSE